MLFLSGDWATLVAKLEELHFLDGLPGKAECDALVAFLRKKLPEWSARTTGDAIKEWISVISQLGSGWAKDFLVYRALLLATRAALTCVCSLVWILK